jgi:hypothetical protein
MKNLQSRRQFLKIASSITGGLAVRVPVYAASAQPRTSRSELRVEDLPKGSAPEALVIPHFPDRLHAFVWRNWPLVPVDRMAKVVAARRQDLEQIAHSMGLGDPPRVSQDQQRRSYITVIKRNWHLLPYAQLLDLLDWTPDQLAYSLREDDFLFIKLGNLKPHCEPLRYQPPSEQARRRAQAIADILRREFPKGIQGSSDPLFGFVERLSRPPAVVTQPSHSSALRFCYSYFALYGDPLLDSGATSFPSGYLARLAQVGVTGVWLQAVLYKLAPFPWQPELSVDYQRRIKNLRSLVTRAGRQGLRVFLYLNEPRAMPLRFFEQHPELKGIVEGDHATVCTSHPEVQTYLADSIESVCRSVPGLGGFFTITGSENLTHCWSHGGGGNCPRCGQRPPADVIAEVNRLCADGIRKSGRSAQLLVWDWGWNDAWAKDIIRQLPSEATLMSVSEWSLPIERGGVKSEVGEYSISAVGPGPRARRHWEWARQRGLKVVAKIQAGNTWELAAVPYIPALENVAQHGVNLREAKVDGLMLGWTLGGYPSPNLEVVAEALSSGSVDDALRKVAEREFGRALAPAVVKAWRGFSAAFREFPYHGGVLYSGPQHLGPANLLWEKPTGYRATMVGFPYDDLEAWRAVYPAQVFIQQLEKVADGFDKSLFEFNEEVASRTNFQTSPEARRKLELECGLAAAVAIHFRSAANQARFVLARQAFLADPSPQSRSRLIEQLAPLLRIEIDLARRLYEIQTQDSRIGFEASNHYFYVPIDLLEKVLNCHHLMARLF